MHLAPVEPALLLDDRDHRERRPGPSVPLLSPERLIARLEAEVAAAPGGVLAFDADGTLWSGDIGDELFFDVLAEGRVAPPARTALARVARAHGLDAGGDGVALAARIFAAFQRGRVPEACICEVITWICAGARRAEVDALARRVAARAGMPRRLRPEVAEILAWAAHAGVPWIVVSASPRPIVEAAVRAARLAPALILAAAPRHRSDLVLPDVERPLPFGPGKPALLRRFTWAPLHAAFGDSGFDADLLRAARVPVAVRPKRSLRAAAPQIPGLIELGPRSR